MATALVVHGYFYQPPRENPWTEMVEREPSAEPYHDWNERIYHESYRQTYRDLFARVFDAINPATLHSVSLGQFRLPKSVYKNMHSLFPDEPLLAWGLEEKAGMVSYRTELARQIHVFCAEELQRYIAADIFFPCPSTTLPVMDL